MSVTVTGLRGKSTMDLVSFLKLRHRFSKTDVRLVA